MGNSYAKAPHGAMVEVDGMTRGAFVLRGALAAGAVYGGAAATSFVQRAFGQSDGSPNDIDILNYLLTLELLEATFYDRAINEISLSGETRALTEELRDNEAAHVRDLTELIGDLGGEPVDPPEFDYQDGLSDESSYLELAQDLEDTGVGAYNGAGPLLDSKEVLAKAGTILQVEGRHAALVRMQRGEEPAPNAFDETFSMSAVMNMVAPYIRS